LFELETSVIGNVSENTVAFFIYFFF